MANTRERQRSIARHFSQGVIGRQRGLKGLKKISFVPRKTGDFRGFHLTALRFQVRQSWK